MKVAGQTWLVVGMARSGVAAARLLEKNGARVVLNDRKERAAFEGALDDLSMLPGMEWRLGEDPDVLWPACDGIVLSPGVPFDRPWIAQARGAGKPVLGEMELGYRMSQGTVVAVTGTNGKTTTTSMIGEMMRNAGRATHVVGNIGVPICSVAEYTRPEDVVVCEVSSFQIESFTSFHAQVAVILNITDDHLDRHGTLERYAAIKRDIMINQTEGDTVVLNWDDDIVRPIADATRARALYFTRRDAVREGVLIQDGSIVYRWGGSERILCELSDLRLTEPHNVENALAAAAVGVALDVPAPVIRHTLRTFRGVEHRMERFASVDGVQYINDSKGTNVDSTMKAIESMLEPTVLLLGGSDKEADYAPLARAVAGGRVKHVVTLGATRFAIGTALAHQGYGNVARCDGDFAKAVAMARDLAQPGDNVLLSPACASFDMFRDYEERGRVFKEIVRRLAGGSS